MYSREHKLQETVEVDQNELLEVAMMSPIISILRIAIVNLKTPRSGYCARLVRAM